MRTERNGRVDAGRETHETTQRTAAVIIIAPDEVREVIAARGGQLYLWTRTHGVCEGKVTLLEASTSRPGESLRFERLESAGFDVFLDRGGRPLPEKIVLELRGRRKTIRAYWNDWAYLR